MKTRKILTFLFVALIAGCVPVMSLHPLYTDKEVVFEEKLLGTWVDDSNDTTMEFTKAEKEKTAYTLILTAMEKEKKSAKGNFLVHLVKLDKNLFLDIYPAGPPCDFEDPNKAEFGYNLLFMLPVHSFVKVDSIEPQLKLRLTDDESMKKLLKKDPNAVKHEMIEDTAVLTAGTKELQKFVTKYADSEAFFSNDKLVLTRKGQKAPAEKDPNMAKVKEKKTSQ